MEVENLLPKVSHSQNVCPQQKRGWELIERANFLIKIICILAKSEQTADLVVVVYVRRKTPSDEMKWVYSSSVHFSWS